MPGAARAGVDQCQGLIIGPGVPTVLINKEPASIVGDAVASHGETPHTKAVIVSGSSSVFIGPTFAPATVQDISIASCKHKVTSGSIDVFIGK